MRTKFFRIAIDHRRQLVVSQGRCADPTALAHLGFFNRYKYALCTPRLQFLMARRSPTGGAPILPLTERADRNTMAPSATAEFESIETESMYLEAVGAEYVHTVVSNN